MATAYEGLAVPALKALCKERGLSGYSKLTRQALIDKLVGQSGPPTGEPAAPTQQPAELPTTTTDALAAPSSTGPSLNHPPPPVAPAPKKRKKADGASKASKKMKMDADQPMASSATPGDAASTAIVSGQHTEPVDPPVVPLAASPLPISIRSNETSSATIVPRRPELTPVGAPSKAQPFPENDAPATHTASSLLHTPSTETRPSSAPEALDVPLPHVQPAKVAFKVPLRVVPSIQELRNISDITNPTTTNAIPIIHTRPSLLPPIKPFKKLIPSKPIKTAATQYSAMPRKPPAATKDHDLGIPPKEPLPDAPRDILLPPRVSQRPQTARLSIILSRVSDASRLACSRVSKAWRYAVYLSAQTVLNRFYAGARLDAFLYGHRKNLAQLNLWPYLRYRQREAQSHRDSYMRSWLYPLFGMTPISSALWCSSEYEEQISVALRFLSARTWLAVNIGDRRAAKWSKSVIIRALPSSKKSTNGTNGEDACASDIWQITVASNQGSWGVVSSSGGIDTFWIIAETGEVIGTEADDPFATSTIEADARALRLDWSNFLDARKPVRLLDRVRWCNVEDYERGISRHWLKRKTATVPEVELTELQKFEKRMAERYILASVAGNSLSGRYQTASEIAQDFAGETSASMPSKSIRAKAPFASLYVPEHHFVESIHFTTSRGEPLHPALAVVQTPTREHYVLRETGSEVGTEEEGVKTVWMDCLGCTASGVAVQTL